MKKILLYLFAIFCFSYAYADTVNINWGADNQLYTTTTCDIGTDVILPTPPTKRGHTFRGWKKDSFNRGTWSNWEAVPNDDISYPEDFYGNRTPTYNDYMVLKYAETYNLFDYNSGNPLIIKGNNSSIIWEQNGVSHTITPTSGIAETFYVGDNSELKIESDENLKLSINSTSFLVKLISKEGVVYYFLTDTLLYGPTEHLNWNTPMTFEFATPLSGTWRFVYDGVWEIDGKLGWKPEYQIINE